MSSKRKTQKKRLSQNTQEEYNKIFRRFIGNPNVRGEILKKQMENTGEQSVIGPTLFYTDTRDAMKKIKEVTRINSRQSGNTIFKDGIVEIHFTPQLYKQKFSKYKPQETVKGTIIIRQETETENIPVHFCGYIYKNKTLYIFDPSYNENDTGTYFTDAFYDFLTEKKIKWKHVMENKPHAWQDPNHLLKEDYFCQTWSLTWLLNTQDPETDGRDFILPKSPRETSQHLAIYFRKFVGLIDQDGKRQDIIELFPSNRWEGYNPNDILNYIRDQITPAIFLTLFHH